MKNSDTANKTYDAQLDFAKKAYNVENILPRRYVFILTNLCNLRCSFCFQERKRKKNMKTTKSVIKKILNLFLPDGFIKF
jgi:sulfatase maturation enzyme AslB (radical SAM superfamily)